MPAASTIIQGAFDLIGVLAAGEPMPAALGHDGLRRLNLLVGQWSLESLTALLSTRHVFPVTANVGTYTIGLGGTFNVPRPASLPAAALLLDSTTELPVPVLTEQAYQQTRQKGLTSTQWTQVYYSPTYTAASPYGTITLWPTPTTSGHDLVLYLPAHVQEFADLTTVYGLAPGYAQALEYTLAIRLAAPYGRPVAPDIAVLAAESVSVVKRANQRRSDLGLDRGLPGVGHGLYNIFTGQ